MANRTRYGLRFHSTVGGSKVPNPVTMWVADDYANRIDIGDVVKRVAGGSAALAAAGEVVYGVVYNIKQYHDGTRLRGGTYLPAATSWTGQQNRSEILVIPVVGNYFIGYTDGTHADYDTEAEFKAFEGENIDVAQNGTPPASAQYLLAISTHAAASGQFRIVRAAPDVDTEWDAAGVPLLVTGNEATTQWPGYVGTEAGV